MLHCNCMVFWRKHWFSETWKPNHELLAHRNTESAAGFGLMFWAVLSGTHVSSALLAGYICFYGCRETEVDISISLSCAHRSRAWLHCYHLLCTDGVQCGMCLVRMVVTSLQSTTMLHAWLHPSACAGDTVAPALLLFLILGSVFCALSTWLLWLWSLNT